MGKLGEKITTHAQTLGGHAARHYGYFKKTLGHGSSAINMAQNITAAAGYAIGRDMSGTTTMLNSAGKMIDNTQQGMVQAENVGKALQKKDVAGLAVSGLQAYGDYRTGRK